MIFEGLDGSFGCVDAVFVGGDELPFDIFAAQKVSDGGGCFIVKDIEFWLETLVFKVSKDVIERVDDCTCFAIGDSSDDDGIGAVVVGYKDILLVFERHCWEPTGEIGISCSVNLVGQCGPAKDVVGLIVFLAWGQVVFDRDELDFRVWWDV